MDKPLPMRKLDSWVWSFVHVSIDTLDIFPRMFFGWFSSVSMSVTYFYSSKEKKENYHLLVLGTTQRELARSHCVACSSTFMLPAYNGRTVAAIADAWQQIREVPLAEPHWRRYAVHQQLTLVPLSSPRTDMTILWVGFCMKSDVSTFLFSETTPTMVNRPMRTIAKQFCLSILIIVLNNKYIQQKGQELR